MKATDPKGCWAFAVSAQKRRLRAVIVFVGVGLVAGYFGQTTNLSAFSWSRPASFRSGSDCVMILAARSALSSTWTSGSRLAPQIILSPSGWGPVGPINVASSKDVTTIPAARRRA